MVRKAVAALALLVLGVAAGRWSIGSTSEEQVAEADSGRVLTIGLHPSAVDYGKYPQIDEATLTARIEAGRIAMAEAGLDVVSCQVPADPDAAEAVLRECAAGGGFRVALIGAGVRMAGEHTILFERLINVAGELAPGIRFAFNTSPETTIDAIRRWL